MKKTPVELLFYALWTAPKDKFVWQSILKQAKEMEEHEIAKAHTAGFLASDNNVYKGGYVYYQENYKK
jgi:hypothetical protein